MTSKPYHVSFWAKERILQAFPSAQFGNPNIVTFSDADEVLIRLMEET
jgi:hypothetical protein